MVVAGVLYAPSNVGSSPTAPIYCYQGNDMPTKKTVRKTTAKPRSPKTSDIGQKIARAFIAGRVAKEGNQTLSQLVQKREKLKAEFILASRKVTAHRQGGDWKEELTRKAVNEFQATKNLPKVEKVECVGSVVKVYTHTLNCYHSRMDKTFEVGRMRIEIDFAFDYDFYGEDDHKSDIKWFNLTREVHGIEAGMNAPHVYSDGVPCLGGFAEIIAPLIADFELSALVQIAIQFIETINPGDYPYEDEIGWPEVTG